MPLPRITERWTVPRSNFVHKKSQENFERITMRRLIQIHDGHPETIEIWLAFLRKHAYYGVGMKANVWEHENLGVGKTMDVSLENLKKTLEPKWAHFGRRKNLETSEKVYELMNGEGFRRTSDGPLGRRSIRPLGYYSPRHASSSTYPKQIVFSGIQPTGIPHLGNYFGALQQWVKIQNGATSTTDVIFSIVDLHAMTLPYDSAQLRLWKQQTLAALLAVGLNPQRSTIFFQSSVRLCALKLDLACGADMAAGAGTLGAYVGFELYRACGIPFTHDTMEGLLSTSPTTRSHSVDWLTRFLEQIGHAG
ncbi:MAG: hypothetical protein Q9200_005408 [Gallowayella weberi]